MKVGLLAVSGDNVKLPLISEVVRELFLKGYDVETALTVFNSTDAFDALQSVCASADSVVILGDSAALKSQLSAEYDFGGSDIVDIDGVIHAFVPDAGVRFIADTVIPAFNSRASTFYDSFIIRTFGKTAGELRGILKEVVKNRNKIVFRFYESVAECEVCIRYSSKMSGTAVDAVIKRAVELTSDCAYSYSGSSLHRTVADTLISGGKTVSIAESFTGGAVASSLTSVAGISAALKESVVAYSNDSKIKRLNVDRATIETYGAVSVETAYEMAANVLIQSGSDYAVATTGNAGPTAEKDGECGVFYIAAGSLKGIHIYKYKAEGDRDFVTQYGVKTALYRLLGKLKEKPD